MLRSPIGVMVMSRSGFNPPDCRNVAGHRSVRLPAGATEMVSLSSAAFALGSKDAGRSLGAVGRQEPGRSRTGSARGQTTSTTAPFLCPQLDGWLPT